jgi:hypothetical protein
VDCPRLSVVRRHPVLESETGEYSQAGGDANMKKISSGSTAFYKKVFPLVWFGFLGFFVVTTVTRDTLADGQWAFLIIPSLMAVFGFILMKKLVWDLVDEVHDGGDFLVVKNGDEEERIPLSNVMNVSASTNMNPPRITLRLVNPGKFGSEVSFSPASRISFNPFAKNPVAEDLIVRVDRARRRGS